MCARDEGEIFVADEARAAGLVLQHELALMEGFELGPVADADQRRLGNLLVDELHQLFLALGIERRGGLVQHDQVGLVDDQPREGEALLLAARQRLLPGAFLVEAVQQMAEPDRFQRFAHRLVLHRVGGHRIGGGAAQRCRAAHRTFAAASGASSRAASRPGLRPRATGRRSRAPACSCRCRNSPTISTFSPGAMSTSASFTTPVPSSSVTDRPRNCSAAVVVLAARDHA